MDGGGKTRNKGSRMREFALMRAGGSQRKMAVSRPFFRSFLQPFSIWLICSQSPPQFSPRRRLCAVMHSWRLCVCLSVCFNRFWKRAHRILMHRRSWVAFFSLFTFFFESHTLNTECPECLLPHVSLSFGSCKRKPPCLSDGLHSSVG